MKYKILQLDTNGRISFTKEELEKLLDEVYENGYEDGRKTTCYYPYWYNPWKITVGDQLTTPLDKPNIVYYTGKTLPNDYYYKEYVGDDPNKIGGRTTTTAVNTDFAPHWTAEKVVYGTTNTSTDKRYTE